MIPRLFQAPAKLNLSLRLLGKRPDGFHELETLMVKLPELHDTLEFWPTQQPFTLECDAPAVPSDERNLVFRAVRAYEKAAGTACRQRIVLKKRIPHGAGLAGGSSDAATTLLALNQLSPDPLDSQRLAGLAAELGSDIPFFLTPGAAICTGRGEKISPADPPPPDLPVLLLKPAFGVATSEAYGRWAGSREISGISYVPREIDGLTLTNDLERPVFEKHRFLAELKQWLLDRRETRAALMSGSGSTVFAILAADADPSALAAAARQELDPSLWHWSGTTGGTTR